MQKFRRESTHMVVNSSCVRHCSRRLASCRLSSSRRSTLKLIESLTARRPQGLTPKRLEARTTSLLL